MDRTAHQIAVAFAQRVKGQCPVKAIYPYGSHVKETAHQDSDIDIAVVVGPTEVNEFYHFWGELFNIAADYLANIEPNLLIDDGNYSKYNFLAEVMETGV